VAYIAFSNSNSAVQNQLWVGMAKETAHQLGTPISSLSAWVEILKDRMGSDAKNVELLEDVNKDVDRLELIADRFSKIGSKPTLEKKNIADYLKKSISYMKKRTSNQVQMTLDSDENLQANLNPPLFEWVIENLLKNALDAISGKGKIEVTATQSNKQIIIEVKDSGKGIPKSKFKTVFQPGYSTKKRGWGLGLTLTKRIIEKYHFGKIFVKASIIGEGTTFRVVLPK